MLMSMGFTQQQAHQALVQTNNVIDMAANLLFSGGLQAPATVQQAAPQSGNHQASRPDPDADLKRALELSKQDV